MGDAATDPAQHDLADASRRSAAVVVPLVLRLLPGVRSVVDYGCGTGTWLAEFATCGVPRVTGLDFAREERPDLLIPAESFHAVDVAHPPGVARHDLALSLEVAQRFPDAAARPFVRNLTSLADLVLFSAAAPLQGGPGHVNERWPSTWVRLFREQGYRCRDVLRPALWNDRRVEWWYRQNLLLFVKEGVLAPALDGLASFGGCDVVHPERLQRLETAPGAKRGAHAATALRAIFDGPELALAERVAEPRSAFARSLRKACLNTERALLKVRFRLAGRSVEAFRAEWRLRLQGKRILRSGLFDADWYARTYPDAAQAGMSPLEHYLRVGMDQGRDPGPSFSAERYLERHPWVAHAGVSPLVHFLEDVQRRAGDA